MKAGLYWRYATRSLLRGGQRTLLAVFCVAVGVLAIVSLQLVGNMVNLGLTGNVREGNGGDLSTRSDISPMSQDEVKSTFETLMTEGRVTTYTAVSGHQAQTSDTSGQTQFYTLRAVDASAFPIAGTPIFSAPSDGTISSLLSGNDVVINKALQKALGASIGDTVSVSSDDGRAFQATVRGVVENVGLFRAPQMVISLTSYAGLHSTSGLPLTYSAVYANVPDHSDANGDAAKKEIQTALPLATVTTTKDALQQQKDNVQNIRYFLQIVGLLALLIGGVGIMNTMQVLLRRRQTEIAMLKTTGYKQRDLYWLFGLEAALLGVVGGAFGAAAGIGVSFIVKGLAEKAFFITLPGDIDPVTVASGVTIGLFTALIFGLIPIVQAGQIRPLAVLRSMPEGSRVGSRLLTGFLGVLLAGMFFALALSILQNVNVAAGAVLGTGVFLLLQSVFFGVIVFVISKIPVPERLRLGSTVMLLLLVAISAGLAYELRTFAPVFGALAVLLALLVVMPRTWKANIKLALRNIGRQRVRTITTMVALLVGVFGIGLIFVLGQNIKDQVNVALVAQGKPNSFIFASSADRAAVDDQLATLSGLQGPVVRNPIAQGVPTTVRGLPIGAVLQGAPTQSGADHTGRQETLAMLRAIQGYDLASGALPDVTMAKGSQDTSIGPNLGPGDVGQNKVIFPTRASLAPLSLKIGDQLGIVGQDHKSTITLTVAGFYDNSNTLTFASALTDNASVDTLSGGNPFYVYSLRLDPAEADQKLHQVQKAVPAVQTFSVVDLLLFINGLLNNVLVLLTAVMSLAVIAGLIIIANAVALAMLERRRELGILKATGFTSRSVLSEVLIEYGIVGFTGGLLAMLLVSGAMSALGTYLLHADLSVGTYIVLGIVALTSAICMLIAGLVAWGATRVRPLEVLRYE